MATYCEVSNITDLAPGLTINAQSKPSDGQVRTMIANAEREVEAILDNLGYATPVAETTPKAQVTELVAHAVLAKVLRSRAYGTGSDADLKAAAAAQKWYDDRIAALGDPDDPFELDGATRTDDEVEKDRDDVVRSFTEDGGMDIDIDDPTVTIDQTF